MAEAEINAFLTHLAVDRNVSASTQNQALSAILFLYRAVLKKELGDFGDVIRAKRRRKMPVVLTTTEVQSVLAAIDSDEDRLILQPGDEARLYLSAKGADDLYFLVEERVVSVTDACEPEFMSSVMTRCATVLRHIYYVAGRISEPFRSFWATRT